ncbi:MAG TPA: EAL domain-containing protein [Candidatus Saccharimonadia bacterium]|nr:EAL domain-containing protein [Candidatus Saccharimonadia bacterium]
MSAAPLRVLLVESDADERAGVAALLRTADPGAQSIVLDSVADANAAAVAIAAASHDVYLIDLGLGEATALGLIERVCRERTGCPAIALDRGDNPAGDSGALAAGAADYLVRGAFDADRLVRAIRYAADHARSQSRLAASEHRYRELFERMPMPLWVFDRQTLQFLAVNEAAIDHYGYSREEFLSMSVLDIRPPEEHGRLLAVARDGAPGLVQSGMWTHRRRDGSLIDVEVSSHGLDWEGRPARIVLAKDVSEQLRAQELVRERARQLRQLLSDAIDALVVVGFDGRIRFANPAFEQLVAAEPDTLEHAPLPPGLELDPGETIEVAIGPEHRIAEARASATVWEGENARVIALRDITARRHAEQRTHLLERAIESSVNGIVVADARTPDLPLLYVNPAFERMTGYPAEQAIGRNCRFLQGADRDQPELDLLRRALAEQRECEVVLRNYRRDGSLFWNQLSLAPVRDGRGEVTHYVGVLNDLSERRRYEAELAYAASHDAVTGLPRYVVLEDYIAGLLTEAARTRSQVALLQVDLDRFHTVNETMGHSIGDQALREVADRLRVGVGARGRVCRLGGDEFVVALPFASGAAEPGQVAEELRRKLEAPIEIAPYKIYLTCSIGMSVYPENGLTPLDLQRRAEAALMRAKRVGRNSVHRFSNEQAHELRDRIALGGRLREAIARGELVLHYQPQVSASNGRIVGMEALVRWQTADMGLLPPARFIRVAEELGLIVDLGRTVLADACRQAKSWLDAGHAEFAIAVNVSALQRQRPQFVEEVRAAIAAEDLPPELLELELTETAIMENVERMGETMRGLKKLGIRMALDDFGIGYSSLNYLKRLPIDKLKIDQSFVREITESSGDAAITRAIIAMGHQLQMTVMAEGVETEAQLGYLRRNHCDLCQGLFFSPPVPPDEIPELLRRRYLSPGVFQAPSSERSLLLLDDEENILQALKRVLRRDGYLIHTATTATQAFDILGRNEVHVIVSDQRLPDTSGTEFLSSVKEMYPDTVRLVLSGYIDLRTVTDAINRGAIYKFLTKPWDDDELRAQIAEAFRMYATRKADRSAA